MGVTAEWGRAREERKSTQSPIISVICQTGYHVSLPRLDCFVAMHLVKHLEHSTNQRAGWLAAVSTSLQNGRAHTHTHAHPRLHALPSLHSPEYMLIQNLAYTFPAYSARHIVPKRSLRLFFLFLHPRAITIVNMSK